VFHVTTTGHDGQIRFKAPARSLYANRTIILITM